jgi:methylglyoxal synthase
MGARPFDTWKTERMGPAMQQMKIALVAHDQKKDALVAWTRKWEGALARHRLMGTGSTAKLLEEACPSLRVEALLSGPEGGDMQIGARIVEGNIDVLIFFPDPMNAHPHEVDFQALIRVALTKDVLFALSPRSADFLGRGIFE